MTTPSQEAFEAWHARRYLTVARNFKMTKEGRYAETNIRGDFAIWDASRKQALEEAAAICKVHATPKMRVSDYAEGYNQSAEVCMEELKELLK